METVTNDFLMKQIFEKKNPTVQFQTGVKLCKGEDIRQNTLIGRLLLTMAAENGHYKAMWNMMMNHKSGRWDFPVNEERSQYWARRIITKLHHDAERGEQYAINELEVIDDFKNKSKSK